MSQLRTKKHKKLVWGICGVGMGHAYRQLRLIYHFSQDNDIAIITHGSAYKLYAQKFKEKTNVRVVQSVPPYLPDGENGIGFKEAISMPRNQSIDFFKNSATAYAKLDDTIGRPDLVIGDYEPLCAQYGYAHNVPIITFDQQSKYLSGDFPEFIHGCNYLGEVMRLQMFYPKVAERIATSFFTFKTRANSHAVTVVPPIIRKEVRAIKQQRSSDGAIVVYLSEYPDTLNAVQLLDEIALRQNIPIIVFAHRATEYIDNVRKVKLQEPDQFTFTRALKTCSGIICTAGHSLLSEAMYLGIPVYALPRLQYEALMCARVIADNGFGLTYQKLSEASVLKFIENISRYRATIQQNTDKVLLRSDGTGEAIKIITSYV